MVSEVGDGLTDADLAGERHTRRLWTAVVVAGGLFAGSLGFAATTEVDHYSFAPGSAVETEPLVTVAVIVPMTACTPLNVAPFAL